MRNRFVRVMFGQATGPTYVPQELNNGNLYDLDSNDWPEVWGYRTPEEARAVIQRIEAREVRRQITGREYK